jgi:hypothetical protein
MNRSRVLVAAAIVAFCLVEDESSAQKTLPGSSRCQSVWVTAPGSGGPTPRARKPLQFSASNVVDLELRVVVPTSAPAVVELKVFTPNGHLYQELSVSSAQSSVPSGSTRRSRSTTLKALFPVAGTTIVNNSLYGTWKVEAYFAGERSACAKPRAFVIKP